MRILKRLAVWFLETALEALLLAFFLVFFIGYDKQTFGNDLLVSFSVIVAMAFSTGYLLSTALSRAIWRGLRLWPYPVIATALFFIHSQIFFVASGGSTEWDKLSIQSAGGCIVFACTFAGSYFLRAWVAESANQQKLAQK